MPIEQRSMEIYILIYIHFLSKILDFWTKQVQSFDESNYY